MKTIRYKNGKTKKLKKKQIISKNKVLSGGSLEVPKAGSARGLTLRQYLKVSKEDQYHTHMSQLFFDLGKEGELLEEYYTKMLELKLCESKPICDVSYFFNNSILNRKFGEQREDLILKTKKRKLNISLLSLLHEINMTDSYPRTDKYNLARRLTIVVDIMSQKGNISCKLAQLLIERLRIVENLLDLKKIIGVLDLLPPGIKNIKDLEFYYGEKQTGIEYIGTNYELIPGLREGAVGDQKFILELETPRDIFMVDFEYSYD